MLGEDVARHGASVRFEHAIADAAKHLARDYPHCRLVVDHQRAAAHAKRLSATRPRMRVRDPLCFGGGQKHAETTAATRARLQQHRPAVRLDDPEHGGEAEAATGELGGEERVEQPCPGVVADAAAVVLDLEKGVAAGW